MNSNTKVNARIHCFMDSHTDGISLNHNRKILQKNMIWEQKVSNYFNGNIGNSFIFKGWNKLSVNS